MTKTRTRGKLRISDTLFVAYVLVVRGVVIQIVVVTELGEGWWSNSTMITLTSCWDLRAQLDGIPLLRIVKGGAPLS